MPKFDSSAFWGIAGIVVGIIVTVIFFLLGKKENIIAVQKIHYSVDNRENGWNS